MTSHTHVQVAQGHTYIVTHEKITKNIKPEILIETPDTVGATHRGGRDA